MAETTPSATPAPPAPAGMNLGIDRICLHDLSFRNGIEGESDMG